MNKKIIFLLLLLPLAGAAYAQGESESRRLQLGVRAGCTVNSLQTSMTQDNVSISASVEGVGWQVGGSAHLNIRELKGITQRDRLGVEANLFFSDRMFRTGEVLHSLYYLDLPVMATYAMPITQKISFKVHLGPCLSFSLADINNALIENSRRVSFGLTGGLGMDFGRFFAGACYRLGMSNVARNIPDGYRQVLRSGDFIIGWNF
jgi:hypothetical protein